MNVRTPFNPPRLAEVWPTVERSIEQDAETKAITDYLKAIDKKAALRPDRHRSRRR